MGRTFPCSSSVSSCPKVYDQNKHTWFHLKTMLLIFDALIWFQRIGQFCGQLWFYDRFHSHHCRTPPHDWSSVGFGMWASWHPCYCWKSGNLEILQLEKETAKLLQISPKDFEAAMARRPKLLVCSVEFLADSQVCRDDPIYRVFFHWSSPKIFLVQNHVKVPRLVLPRS